MDVTQRKMLRRIVGWRRIPEEPWDITMHRIKLRVNDALHQHQVKPWSLRVNQCRWHHACRVRGVERERWVRLACEWTPNEVFDLWHDHIPYRRACRPFLKWDDTLAKFSQCILGCKWYDDVFCSAWHSHSECFLKFC